MREVYAATPDPAPLQGRLSDAASGPPGTIHTRIAVREPFAADDLHRFLALHAVAGVEAFGPGWYERAVRLPARPGRGPRRARGPARRAGARARFTLTDARDLAPAMERTRRLLDADEDPVVVDEALVEDALLAPLVSATPGLRVPGHLDGPRWRCRRCSASR